MHFLKEPGLTRPPKPQFFMNLRDLAFWIRSARADARLARLRGEHENTRAFDLLYGEEIDPWGAEVPSYRYQRRKYDLLVSMIPRRPYRRALDLGCGRGEIARRLSPYVEQILGVDISSSAVQQALQLSKAMSNVEYRQADVLSIHEAAQGQFDLIIMTDTLYYLSPLDDAVLKRVQESLEALLAPGGILLLVNHFFFGFDPDSRVTRRIHNSFRQTAGLKLRTEYRRPFYLVSLFERCAAGGEV